MLKYASIDNIAKRLESRITVITSDTSTQVMGITGSSIGTGIIELLGEAVEDFIDMYLSMIYVMPLRHNHPYLNAIVEKLIVSDVYNQYFPTPGETSEGTESFPARLRQQALDEFQVIFDGLGIYVPGSSNSSNSLQNNEQTQQLTVKAIILPGEELKNYIGYDYNGDSVSDSDLFKLNSNVQPSFYSTGDFENLEQGTSADVINNIRVRPRDYRPDEEYISFF